MINAFILSLLIIVFLLSAISSGIIKAGLKGARFELAILTLGMLMGPSFLNLLNYQVFYQMEPLLLMALAWTGISVGMQLHTSILSKFSWSYYVFTLVEYLTTYILIYLLLLWIGEVGLLPGVRNSAIHIIAAIVAISSPFHIFSTAGRGEEFNLVKFAGSFDGIIGIILFQLILIIDHPSRFFEITHFTTLQLFLVVLSLSIIIGLMLYWAISFRFKKNEFTLLSIGFTLVIGGTAGINLFSPLFMGLVVGLIATNLSPRYFIFSRTLISGEKPIFFLFLFLAGVSAESALPLRIIALVVVVVVFARLIGKVAGSMLSGYLAGRRQSLPASVLLIPEGNLSLLLAVNYALLFPDINGDLIFATVVGAYIVNQILGLLLTTGGKKE